MIYIGSHTPTNIVIPPTVAASVKQPDGTIPPFALPPIMGFLILAAQEFPTWKFEVSRVGSYSSSKEQFVYATRVMVFNERGVHNGRIELESYGYHSTDVEFYNERISRDAQRGNCKRTSKQDVALKLLRKWFTEPPLPERMETAQEEVASLLSNRAYVFKNNAKHTQNMALGLLREYVIDNIDTLWGITPEFQSHIKANPSFTLEHFKVVMNDMDIAESVMREKCLTVLIEDGKYIVRRGNSSVSVMTSDQLSESMRRAIGMLKLVDDGQFVRDMGFRAKENLYYIVDTLTEEEQCKTSN